MTRPRCIPWLAGSVVPLVLFLAPLAAARGQSQTAKAEVVETIDQRADTDADVARQIWHFAEVGYQEERSSALLQRELRAAGFDTEAGVAQMPTAGSIGQCNSGRSVSAGVAYPSVLRGRELRRCAMVLRSACV